MPPQQVTGVSSDGMYITAALADLTHAVRALTLTVRAALADDEPITLFEGDPRE